jgi:fatty acid desaturase/cytochrome b involved in lipid metabolism
MTIPQIEPEVALLDTEQKAKRRRIEVHQQASRPESELQVQTAEAKAVWSSGVPFYPPSKKYWRIGGKWYDFASFLQKHPGGSEALLMCRDRFEDCTFVFESHHHNFVKARAIIKKYEVAQELVRAEGLRSRPNRGTEVPAHHDGMLDAGKSAVLLPSDSFYSVVRQRVTEHLRSVGCPDGGPTSGCVILFWITVAAWVCSWLMLWYTGSFLACPILGFFAAQLGAFGHNWVHQPKYKRWAMLSLDTIGFSSDQWCREHNLQHHMYTNTPWDNHFKGTDPFLVTDPTVERHWIQRFITPYLNPAILCFGMWGNWTFHFQEVLLGHEVISPAKMLIPSQLAVMISAWGSLRGLLLVFLSYSVMSVYYFTMALMNHNAEHCMDVTARNAARDWGEAQLQSSADWGVHLSFWSAWRYLWLNYHTVHHMFPRIDFSHHGHIQSILMKTCDEFGVKYRAGKFIEIYREMMRSFSTPQSLMQEIIVYSGGL